MLAISYTKTKPKNDQLTLINPRFLLFTTLILKRMQISKKSRVGSNWILAKLKFRVSFLLSFFSFLDWSKLIKRGHVLICDDTSLNYTRHWAIMMFVFFFSNTTIRYERRVWILSFFGYPHESTRILCSHSSHLKTLLVIVRIFLSLDG